MRTARAKGCGDVRVMANHVLRNALIPILTRVVVAIPFLFTGSLLLESFFGIPGLGSMTVDAIHGNDFVDAAHDGVHRVAALHRRTDRDRRELHAGRSARAARVGRRVEAHVVSNLVVALLLAGAAAVAIGVRRSDLWRASAVELARRRPIALAVVGVYLAVALLDSVSWVGGGDAGESGNALDLHRPRTVIDRAFPLDFDEKSYSAPLASAEFYGGAPLDRPGRHLLGTDILGRDVLHLTLKGTRVALLIGGFTSLIVIPLALLVGVSAGYFGGRIDDVVFFVMSTLASIPNLLLLIALIMAMGRGPTQVCVAMGVTSWVGFCRIVRGETLKLRELDYVQAARALGVSEARLIWRHILPNLMHLVVITFVLLFSGLVLSEAILSYLGIGIDGSWGQMIDQARDELARDPIIWWNLAAASSALFALILAVNFVGDAVRDVLDPRTLRERQ